MSPIVVRLREWREHRGLTQLELATRAGVRQATVSDLETKTESGRLKRLDLVVLDRLGKALGTTGDALFRAPEIRQTDRRSARRARGRRGDR